MSVTWLVFHVEIGGKLRSPQHQRFTQSRSFSFVSTPLSPMTVHSYSRTVPRHGRSDVGARHACLPSGAVCVVDAAEGLVEQPEVLQREQVAQRAAVQLLFRRREREEEEAARAATLGAGSPLEPSARGGARKEVERGQRLRGGECRGRVSESVRASLRAHRSRDAPSG